MFVPIFNMELALTVERDGGDVTATIPLAHCADTNRLVTVDAKLAFVNDLEIQMERGLINEFSFEFAMVYLYEPEQSFKTQDRNIVASYLNDDCRSLALPAVLKSIPLLVEVAVPDRIYRVTKRGNLPPNALRKHDLITKVTCPRQFHPR